MFARLSSSFSAIGLAACACALMPALTRAAPARVEQHAFNAEDAGGLRVAQGAQSGPRSLSLKLHIDAAVAADASGYRVIAASAHLKGEGAAGKRVGLEATGGLRSLKHAATIAFAFDPLGPLAQSAASLCANANAAGARREMIVPVVVSVETGRLDFAALATSGVPVSEAHLADADLYLERQTDELEAGAKVAVDCASEAAPRPASVAVGAEKPAAAKVSSGGAKVVRTAVRETEAVTQTQVGGRDAPAAPEPRVALPQGEAIACEDGMVRQTAAGSLCLCPGNTIRTKISGGVYACKRRLARRR